jgi:mannose-6-phosphate isomerase-like protein (cupin superfamily)
LISARARSTVAAVTETPTFEGTGAVASAADAETFELGDAMLQLLLDASHTGGAVSAHRCRLPNGAVGASPHQHLTASELFYVLSGRADLLAGTRLIRACEGDLVVVPPRSAHAFAAAPNCNAELFVVITPGVERFEFFRNLVRVRAGELDMATFMASQAEYDTYPADAGPWSTRPVETER